jgi:hypothetical protein
MVMAGEKEVLLQERPQGVMGIIERLASDPNFDTAKLEKLIELHERTQANAARAEFYDAFATMQGEIAAIARKGKGDKGTRYMKDEDIQAGVRPVLQAHGFMLSFAVDFPEGGKLRVTGKLAHRAGHVETSEFVSVADTSGSKNAIQALGSTQSYGKRYTTIALLNITGTDQSDDDGAAAGRGKVVDPTGFEDWWADLELVADEGFSAYSAAWKGTKNDAFRKHVLKHYSAEHEQRKAKAQRADKAAQEAK